MKKIVHKLILVCLLILVCGAKCKKSMPSLTLPPITQEGKNTFGCKINGQIWIPYFPCKDIVAGTTELSYLIEPWYIASDLPIFFSLTAGTNANGSSFFDVRQNATLSDH